jgi:L,D-transpeptidase catalytic domain
MLPGTTRNSTFQTSLVRSPFHQELISKVNAFTQIMKWNLFYPLILFPSFLFLGQATSAQIPPSSEPSSQNPPTTFLQPSLQLQSLLEQMIFNLPPTEIPSVEEDAEDFLPVPGVTTGENTVPPSSLPENYWGNPDGYPLEANPAAMIHLVIRLSDRRVYVYERDTLRTSFPIAIGRDGWETPVGKWQVIQMVEHPSWLSPFNGEVIPPGADNPLGSRWIGFWTDGTNTIGFHGTPNERSIGRAASHGCVRMYDQDVIALFEMVSVGTPVEVVP